MKKQQLYLKFYLFLFLSIWIAGCSSSSDPTPTPQDNKYLVSSTLITNLTKTQIITNANVFFGSDPTLNLFIQAVVKSDLKVYKVIYKTKNADNTDIQASGLLVIPSTTEAMPLISYQHGTQTDETFAPSYFNLKSTDTQGVSLISSNNFIISCPDYIGYGVSKNLEHPYQHRESLAQSSLDMTRASIEFLKQEKTSWNNKLMLTGYSEGGFATMALMKKIEQQFPTEFSLTATTCGAGGYNLSAFVKTILNETTQGVSEYNNYYAWVLRTYNKIYGLNRQMNVYLKEPYATSLQNNGINASLPGSFNLLVTDSFKKGINDGTDTPFINAIKDNDTFDWKPSSPLQLYHGSADKLIFYSNSESTYNAMIARGATNVELKKIEGKDHIGSIQDYLLGTFTFFSSKR